MAKLCNLLDELPELDKRVYALRLLTSVDVSSLNDRDFNSWIGLLFDSVDLLDQTAFDINTLSHALSDSAT